MGAFNGGRGNWEIANSSSPLPSVHQLAGEEGKRLVAPWYLGEKVTLEKKERYLHFAGTAPSRCQCAV